MRAPAGGSDVARIDASRLAEAPPRRAPVEEPFFAWMRREWVLVLITVGISIDWLPWLLSPFVPLAGNLSGTKLFVLPGLVAALVTRPSWFTRPHAMGALYLGAILIGGGLGWLAGNVEPGRVAAIVVNGLILMYFLRVRSLVSIRRVLAIAFALSLLVPLIQDLTKLGVISAAMLQARGLWQVPGDTRIFSIFDSTTVGLLPLLTAAALGGLIFVRARAARRLLVALLAMGVLAFGATSALVAQQRSGVAAYAASGFVAWVLYLVAERRRPRWVLTVVLVSALASAPAVYFGQALVQPLLARFSNAPAYEGAKELRLGGFSTFVADVAANPLNPVPKGHQSLLDRAGVEPHLLLSEAYYEGGPLFLAAIVVIVCRFAGASLALARWHDEQARTIGIFLCAFGAGAAIQVSLQTALALRVVPMILGLGLAARHAMRAQEAELRDVTPSRTHPE